MADDPKVSWDTTSPATPLTPSDIEAYNNANAAARRDLDFRAQLKELMDREPDVQAERFWEFAGRLVDPSGPPDGLRLDTFHAVHTAYRQTYPMPTETQKHVLKMHRQEQARIERERRRAAELGYAEAYADYLEECRDRKARHDAARQQHISTVNAARAAHEANVTASRVVMEKTIADSTDRMRADTGDAAPVPPVKPN